MTILDKANCANPDSVFNVGVPPCDLAKGKMKMVILLDRGVTFTADECSSVVAFLAALKAKTYATRGSRAYPIVDILNFEDNTGDPSTGNIGNLTTATIVTSDAIPSFRFGYNGSEARHRRMALIASAPLDVLFVDDKFAVYGTAGGDDGDELAGFNILQGYAETTKFIVADAVNQYAFRITLGNIAQYRDLSRYVVTNQGVLSARGLVNATLLEVGVGGTDNVRDYSLTADGGTDLVALHGAAIAALTFTAATVGGTSVAITSVAVNAGKLRVTYNSTAWTNLDDDEVVQLNGPIAAALNAAGVAPFEILPALSTEGLI